MTMYNNELFPLAVVPVLSFCDPGLADINADLATIYSVNQLCKKTTIITIHFHSIFLYGSSRCTPYGRTPLTDFWMTGPGTVKRLEKHGIRTMGELAYFSTVNQDILYKEFGVDAELLIDHYCI